MTTDLQGLVLKGVTKVYRQELGHGSYGSIYAVKYCGTICAAKEIILVEGLGEVEIQQTVESFIMECYQCSTLRHPNVIQFLGIYYPSATAGSVQERMRLPVMVMEMMADSLTSLVDKHEKIPLHMKYSIVHDVSLGLCYLHNHDPPIVHRDLSPSNILLTAHHVAKISDIGLAKVLMADYRMIMADTTEIVDLKSPESLGDDPIYGPPTDVFSFGGILLYTFNQLWPRPIRQVHFDPILKKKVTLSEVERRQQHLDKMIEDGEMLISLVEECLDDDPAVRPPIVAVCEKIEVSKDAVYMKESIQDTITLHQQSKQMRSEIGRLKSENYHLRLSSTRSVPLLNGVTELSEETLGDTDTSKLRIEAPPLIPALITGRYYIKWTQLADLPAPMYRAFATVQNKKVYIAGGTSPVDYAMHRVFVYDINTDRWDQLPPSGYHHGIPHIIGCKLALIGGCLSTAMQRTNKVSTFDETNQTWTSYYPDLLSARSTPGVVTHLENVIVAGGRAGDDTAVAQDDIEVFNWIENSHWRKVSINLPVPMWSFTPIIADDYLVIVGYSAGSAMKRYTGSYKIPVTNITNEPQKNSSKSNKKKTKWTTITSAPHWSTALVSNSFPLMAVGGQNYNGTPTSDIKMYDECDKSWRTMASLSSARTDVAVAAVSDNAIIAIGGFTKAGSVANALSSSLTTVELGQVQLLH